MRKNLHALHRVAAVFFLLSWALVPQVLANESTYVIPPPIAELLRFKPALVTRTISSHDQNGGNGDGSVVGNKDESGYKVLFHGQGEGRITRLWMTAPKEKHATDYQELWIIVDGQTVYQGPVLDFFSGNFSQAWQAPLVMDFEKSSGAFLSYIPFPYKRDAKILLKGTSYYYQVSYQQGDGASNGPTAQQLSQFLKDEWWKSILNEPGLEFQAGKVSAQKQLEFKASAGWVSALAVEVASRNFADLFIQVADQPAVPLSFFFGLASLGTTDETWPTFENALHYSNGDKGLFMARLPIPLYLGEDIRIFSNSNQEQEIRFHYWKSPDPLMGPVRLNTIYKEQMSPTIETTMLFARLGQATNFVSMVEEISEGQPNDRTYLEGDEMIRTDQMRYPTYLGTGTEDYFNGGWYFLGTHANPLSGMPRFYVDDPSDEWKHARFGLGLYRHHVLDPVVSRAGFALGFEAGPTGNYQTARYRSLAMAYTFPSVRLVHNVVVPLPSVRSDNFYEQRIPMTVDAEKVQSPRLFTVRYTSGYSDFWVSCPNLNWDARQGVFLTHAYDAAAADQKAFVRLNSRVVGLWYESYANPTRRFAEHGLWIDLYAGDCRNGLLHFEIFNQGNVLWSEQEYGVNFYTYY